MSNPLSTLSDNIKIDRTKCTACGICTERCILNNLQLNQAPCRASCPMDINAQALCMFISQKKWNSAYGELSKKTAFPGLLAYGCKKYCPSACRASLPISLLEQYVCKKISPILYPIHKKKTEQIALLGYSPAAIQAAWLLCRAGYSVTLYHSQTITPLLFTEKGVPEQIAQNEFAQLTHWQISFREQISLDKQQILSLLDMYQAIFIDTGIFTEWNNMDKHPISLQLKDYPQIFAGTSSEIAATLSIGTQAGESILRFLAGNSLVYGRSKPLQNCPEPVSSPSSQPAVSNCETDEQAVKFAEDCLHCGYPEGHHRACWLCFACENSCPQQALKVEIPYIMA